MNNTLPGHRGSKSGQNCVMFMQSELFLKRDVARKASDFFKKGTMIASNETIAATIFTISIENPTQGKL
jgi:hypothetical protein